MAISETLRLRAGAGLAAIALGVASAALAQNESAHQQQGSEQTEPAPTEPAPGATEPGTPPPSGPGNRPLNLPENPEVYGSAMPSVIKATAIVNGQVITQTDIGQRLALLATASGGRIPPDQIEPLRQQVLRNLIDETLQIQAAKADKIEVDERDIDRAVQRVAERNNQSVEALAEYLKNQGSSINTLRRQIHGEIAWTRLQQRRIESFVNVAEDEVNAVLDRLNAAKGTDEYRISEIYLPAPGGNLEQATAAAGQIVEQLRNGASFTAYARQYSEASTAAVGGDLGWVRPAQLPQSIATALQTMTPGQVTAVPVPGGISIIAVVDQRKILAPDPRNAILSLKQISVNFPAGSTRADAEPIVARFSEAARNVGGCGGAEKIASDFNAEIVSSDEVRIRDLPPALQQIMLPMQVGQATPPFGTIEDGVRVLVICGRDEDDPTAPTFDQVLAQLNEERINLRARRYLRDLRRDAVIEFR